MQIYNDFFWIYRSPAAQSFDKEYRKSHYDPGKQGKLLASPNSIKKEINKLYGMYFYFFSYFCTLNFVGTTFFKQHRLCTYFIITFCQTASEWKENHCMKIPKTSKLPNWFTLPPSEDGSYSALDDPLVKGNFFFKNNVFIKLNIHILLII